MLSDIINPFLNPGNFTSCTGTLTCTYCAQRGMPDKKAFEIVVSKYKEDVSWIERYKDNVTLYSKLEGDPYIPLPNIGRETGTYLYHIVTHFDELADRTLFIQGAPFEHQVQPFACHAHSNVPYLTFLNSTKPFLQDHVWYVDGELKTTGQKTNKVMKIEKEAVLDFWNRYIKSPMPGYISYNWGAQFSISKERIRSLGKDHLQELYELTQAPSVILAGKEYSNYLLCVLFETMWPYIFYAQNERPQIA